jgi:transposase
MVVTERITMTMREVDRFKVIQDVTEGRLKPWRAAERLGLTTRQIRRLATRYRESGAAGLVSRKRGMPGNRRLDDDLAQRALAIVRERYADFGPTLSCEKLRECHGIRLAKETVRHLMTNAGLWIPRRQRPPKIYHPQVGQKRAGCIGHGPKIVASYIRRKGDPQVAVACSFRTILRSRQKPISTDLRKQPGRHHGSLRWRSDHQWHRPAALSWRPVFQHSLGRHPDDPDWRNARSMQSRPNLLRGP